MSATPATPTTPSSADAASMTLIEHLRELRTRVVYATVGWVVAAGLAWFFHEEIFAWLIDPYVSSMTANFPDQPQYLQFRSLIEPFVVYIKTSMIGGTILAAPFILLQLWLFVGPGLHDHERRLALPFLAASVFCFFGGVAFCRYLVLEPTMGVLIEIGITSASPAIMMQEYFSFTTRMLLVFGMLFELPVVMTFLSLYELVTSSFLMKQWRYAIIITFIVAAVLTPPDPLSQTLLAIPMMGLYLLSIGICRLIERSRARAKSAEGAK